MFAKGYKIHGYQNSENVTRYDNTREVLQGPTHCMMFPGWMRYLLTA